MYSQVKDQEEEGFCLIAVLQLNYREKVYYIYRFITLNSILKYRFIEYYHKY